MTSYSSALLEYGDVISNTRNTVHMATHKETHEKLVIKSMPINEFSQREIHILCQHSHQYMMKVYTIEQIFNTYVIVMKYEPGGSLVDLIKRGPVREPSARDIFLQLVEVVTYLHSSGVVHRDIKLDNILLDEQQNVVLIDFEFASLFDPQTLNIDEPMYFCGTPEYSPPELRFKKRIADPRKIDSWSLGVVLYLLVIGHFPFSEKDLKKKSISCKLNYPISGPCKELLRSLLNPDPEKRLLTTDLLIHPWILQGYSPDKKKQQHRFLTKRTQLPTVSKEIMIQLSNSSSSSESKLKDLNEFPEAQEIYQTCAILQNQPSQRNSSLETDYSSYNSTYVDEEAFNSSLKNSNDGIQKTKKKRSGLRRIFRFLS